VNAKEGGRVTEREQVTHRVRVAEDIMGGAVVPEAVLAEPRDYRWVYLWRWPLRVTHWIAAVTITVLIVTGFYIGKPYFMTGGEASSHFMMGWARFLHFAAAGLLVAAAIVRIYWLFAGGRYARWTSLFPVTRRDHVNLFRMIKYYAMVAPEKAPHYLGHNPLQQVSYTLIYAIVLIQIATGFAMYGLSNPGGTISALFGWVGPLLGGWQTVRFVHHLLTWVLVTFIPVHIYLSFRADVVDREGEMSSIFSGGRFVRADVDYEDD
jgi:Ni/Fe-hydrogenase 1 B-type cytochrome subunit